MDSSQHGTPAKPVGVTAQRHRPVAGAAAAATILILLELVREIFVTVANWRDYFVIRDYLAGTATEADLDAADSFSALATWPTLPEWIAAGVAFLIWLWRARINAELLAGPAAHRRSRGWVVGAWMAPVVNLWYPYQVVSDIWQSSAPRRPAPSALVNAWWALFVAATLVKPVQWRLASHLESEQDALTNANVSTLLTALYLAAGALVILIIRRITAWQSRAV
ncbi:DUF4328 domain-containing protein [Streptomyces klenkii]|uniref:DUF4328 domain-containing protein n=1 Tax=Streptomyces klenkii TaxID=1420899 RepID=UPI0033A8400D